MRILVAVDGSDQAYEAIRAIIHFQQPSQVILLHVIDVPAPMYPTVMPEVSAEIRSSMEQAMRQDGDSLLSQAAAMLPFTGAMVTKRLEVGRPADIIPQVAQEEDVNLLIMGTRGLGPIKERLLGSVSHRVLTHAPCAALIVHKHIRQAQRILLAVQGTDDSEAALRYLATHPFRESVEITVLTVPPMSAPPWPAGATVTESMKQDIAQGARYFVEGVATRLTAMNYKTTGVAMLGVPVTTILEAAAQFSSDLILLGSRRREGVSRFVLGSVSHALLHQAPYPVLVFR